MSSTKFTEELFRGLLGKLKNKDQGLTGSGQTTGSMQIPWKLAAPSSGHPNNIAERPRVLMLFEIHVALFWIQSTPTSRKKPLSQDCRRSLVIEPAQQRTALKNPSLGVVFVNPRYLKMCRSS